MNFIKLQKTDFKQGLEPVLLLRPFRSTELTALGGYFICCSTTWVITRLYVNKALFAKWTHCQGVEMFTPRLGVLLHHGCVRPKFMLNLV